MPNITYQYYADHWNSVLTAKIATATNNHHKYSPNIENKTEYVVLKKLEM